MLKRTISAIAYVAILLGFFLLKIFVHDAFFDVLTYAFALIGTYEILRAMKDKTTKAQRVIVMIFAIVCIPACAASEYFFTYGLHVTSVCFFVLSVALVSLLVIRHDETTLENIGLSFLAAVYPTLLLSTLILANHVPVLPELEAVAFNSDALIMLIFVISPLADVFALFFGMLFKRVFPKKLAPVISPNKTVVGAIGGLIGGVVGAAVLYFIYGWLFGSYQNMGMWLTIYMCIGFLGAAATEFGDLVESCIKRKLGIKDMGKIMPGHGGILDRIDGTLFTAMVVYFAFAVVRMFII